MIFSALVTQSVLPAPQLRCPLSLSIVPINFLCRPHLPNTFSQLVIKCLLDKYYISTQQTESQPLRRTKFYINVTRNDVNKEFENKLRFVLF